MNARVQAVASPMVVLVRAPSARAGRLRGSQGRWGPHEHGVDSLRHAGVGVLRRRGLGRPQGIAVASIRADADGWRLEHDEGADALDRVAVAVPAPQVADLLGETNRGQRRAGVSSSRPR